MPRELPRLTVRLMGGAGNQLFQYAFIRGIAARKNRAFSLDARSGFECDKFERRFALGYFNIVESLATPAEIPPYINRQAWGRRLRTLPLRLLGRRIPRLIRERHPYRYDAAIARRARPGYYFGYWQNPRYFENVRDELRAELTPRIPLDTKLAPLVKEMSNRHSVSVHVRRLHALVGGRMDSAVADYYGSCSPDYYQQAVRRAASSPESHCYIFSDDIAWCRAHLQLPFPCHYISGKWPCSDLDELMLMAACGNHVVSNSTFSWWGAWLGKNPAKRVVAPRQWINDSGSDTRLLFPKEWIII